MLSDYGYENLMYKQADVIGLTNHQMMIMLEIKGEEIFLSRYFLSDSNSNNVVNKNMSCNVCGGLSFCQSWQNGIFNPPPPLMQKPNQVYQYITDYFSP